MISIERIIVWSLFDSGNGSYAKVASDFSQLENYSIGVDRENKNNHFINYNLADYSCLFGEDDLFTTLDKLPKPDVILASPPCESWSVASAMRGGNACWKQETGDALFEPQQPLSRFTIRNFDDYKDYQFKPIKSQLTRINGELTIINTIRIIKRYEPAVYVIENPAYGRIWEYIDEILGHKIEYDNLTYYNNYNDYIVRKPTKLGSNIDFNLKKEVIPNEIDFRDTGWNYNERSNIPQELVRDILNKSIKYVMFKKSKKTPHRVSEVIR